MYFSEYIMERAFGNDDELDKVFWSFYLIDEVHGKI